MQQKIDLMTIDSLQHGTSLEYKADDNINDLSLYILLGPISMNQCTSKNDSNAWNATMLYWGALIY